MGGFKEKKGPTLQTEKGNKGKKIGVGLRPIMRKRRIEGFILRDRKGRRKKNGCTKKETSHKRRESTTKSESIHGATPCPIEETAWPST